MAYSLRPQSPDPFLTGPRRRCRQPQELMVAEHLDDMLCCVGDDALMECRVDGPYDTDTVWYKNGRKIQNMTRYRVTKSKAWQRLVIKDVRETDQGVYCVIFSNEVSQVITSAILFVPTLKLNEVAYYTFSPYDCTRIVRQLSPVTVNVGEKIELLLELETYIQVKHFWYKDDVKILPTERTYIDNSNSHGHLIIRNAIPEDSGIYVILLTTRDGVLSSYAAVHVLDHVKGDIMSQPAIVEHLKRDLDVYENQYVKLLCRGMYDKNTCVRWYMNDIHIKDCQLLLQDYGNGYTALKIIDTFPELSGKYRVVLHNKKTNTLDVSTCNLSIHRSNLKLPICSGVMKPLESAVAVCGARVVFDCTFSQINLKHLRVIWFVGRYKVERSNRKFGVICKGGSFILYIKEMAIGMAGEVVCEIHQWEQSPKFMQVSQSIAHLTMVPPGFLADANETGDMPSKLYNRGSHSTPESFFEELNRQKAANQARAARPRSADDVPSFSPHGICNTAPIKFKFCRLDEEGRYFLFLKDKKSENRLYYNHPTRILRNKREVSLFHWTMPRAVGAWFAISCQNNDGSQQELGVISTPELEVEGPLLENMIYLGITAITPIPSNTIYRPFHRFRLETEFEMKVMRDRSVRKYEEFEDWYKKTEEMVGGGAFGKVALVEDKFKEIFAAKFIRVHERNKSEFALREFYTLRKLTNKSVVSVADAYVHNDFIVLIMEYLWGGELFERITQDKYVNETDISDVVKQICDALVFVHSQNVVHLDLKPENIVFAHPNSTLVKLVDFGLSRVVYEGSKIRAVYGTREYVAPEVLKFEPVNLNSDMWSLGVVVFMILSGTMPFDGDTEAEQTSKITTAQYNFDDPSFRTITDVGKDFIDNLLVVSPRRRLKAVDALKHPWLAHGPPKGSNTGSLKLARAKLKIYMRIYRAKWQQGTDSSGDSDP